MAGTIPSLALSTQFDATGNLLAGGKLNFYQANSLTPQNVFKDTGLTLPLPNPITLDASGRVPEFYCADGNIRARLTDAAGEVQFDAANLLVIGPSSGGGGGGGSVDPTTIFTTGDVLWLDVAGPRTGWVRDNGRTIGSATSGAQERANSDCQPLFQFIWQTYPDTICPVPGGRGASSLADWTANKQITLPDKRGHIPGGLDDMGNTAAGRYSGVPVVSGDTVTPGSILGEALNTLAATQIPAHTHPITDPGHSHGISDSTINVAGGPGGNRAATGNVATSTTNTTGITVNANTSAGGSHNNVQKTVLGTFYRKL